MKPAPFAYYAPATLGEALELLARYGEEAKVLAGGQSLVPAMNFRLAQPTVLVDLGRIDGLAGITETPEGLRIGAMTRQRAVERSPSVARRSPLLAETLPSIAHPQIRTRGTFGGSLAHADPAAELPAVARVLGARFRLVSTEGERWLDADHFFTGLFETALAPDELLTEIVVPDSPTGTGWAFDEMSRRHGDYALVGVAATMTYEDGRVSRVRIALLSVGEGPVRAIEAENVLGGESPSPSLFEAAATAVADSIDPPADLHASAEYRRHLARVLVRRVLGRAAERVR